MKKPMLVFCCTALCFPVSSLVYSSDLAFDPTRPSAYVTPKVVKKRTVKSKPQKKISGYSLQSILIGENRRVATINNKTYMLGEKLDNGATLIAIMPNYIEIKRYNQKKKILLFKTQVRQ